MNDTTLAIVIVVAAIIATAIGIYVYFIIDETTRHELYVKCGTISLILILVSMLIGAVGILLMKLFGIEVPILLTIWQYSLSCLCIWGAFFHVLIAQVMATLMNR